MPPRPRPRAAVPTPASLQPPADLVAWARAQGARIELHDDPAQAVAGARCADLEGKVGTLTPGKEADIVLLRADRINVWPLNNAPSAVVNIMNPGHVDTVLVRGKVRKWRGHLTGVDVARVLRLAEEARDAVLRRSGFRLDIVG